MKALRKIIFVIALIVFLVSAGYLARYFWIGHQSEQDFKSLRTEDGHDLKALYKENSDLVGWIHIDDTRIDYPVMQTKDDPEFYLRRSFRKEYQEAGTPFMDAYSDMDSSANWIIYGHHMHNGTMFYDLLKYDDDEFYEKHRFIQFDTITNNGKTVEEGTYEVVAVFRSKVFTEDEDVFKYYHYAGIYDEYSYDDYVRNVKALSIRDTGVIPVYDEQLITLSTCEHSQKDGRYVLVARKVDAAEADKDE